MAAQTLHPLRRDTARPRALLLAALTCGLLATSWGCKRHQEPAPGAAASARAQDRSGRGDLAAAGEAAYTTDLAAGPEARKGRGGGKRGPDGDKPPPRRKDPTPDEENVDHWKGVQFDVHNFDEVLDYLTTYYIDEHVDVQRAWIAAANGALAILTPEAELLPESFYRARRGIAEEEGRLDGRTERLRCGATPLPHVIVHRIPSRAYLRSKRKNPKKRLSDEEIQALRAKSKRRYAAYRKAWSRLRFNRDTFNCVMAMIERELEGLKNKRSARAWPPSAVIAGVERGLKATKRAAKETTAGKATAGETAAKKSRPAAGAEPGAGKKEAAGKTGAASRRVGVYDEDPDDARPGRKPPEPDMNRAWLAAASSYLYALDPHSAIISRTAWDESTRQTQDASFEGIGAVLYQREDVTIIENPMEGLPAWRANVRAGDRILKVDGTDVRGWMLGKVVKLIRGPKNTKVVLTLEREGVPEPFDVPIVRARIAIKNVTGMLLKEYPGIAHIKMTGFVPRSARDLRDMIEKLSAKAPGGKLKGLVLDLRRNSGGLLNRAIDIADMFLRKGRIVSVKSRRKNLRPGRETPEETHEARDQPSDLSMPLVVLVNDGSASASEIVASAIQENGRGLVLGLRTFGKASVQTLFEPALHLDYYIKLTVARYYAPSGGTIQVTGVHPDKIVPPEIDGKIPVGFREENLTNHLEPVEQPKPSPWAKIMPELDRCVARTGTAKRIVKREKNPRIRPDFQLLTAADYLRCLNLRRTGTVAR